MTVNLELRSGPPGLRTPGLIIGGLAALALAGLVVMPGWAGAAAPIAQSCGSNGGRCCIDSEGRRVPPGTRNGPYTCLPDGSWG